MWRFAEARISDEHFGLIAGAHSSGRPPQQFSVKYASRPFIALKLALYMIDRLLRREFMRPANRS